MEVIVGGLGVWTARKIHNHLKEKRDAKEYDYTTAQRREVLSMLVHGLYFRDLDKLGDTVATFLGYQDGRAENYGRRHWRPYRPIVFSSDELSEPVLKDPGLELFLPRDPHPNQSAPHLAIVFRGTIPHNLRDLAADWKISVGLLHDSKRIQRSQTLVWRVVQEFRRCFEKEEDQRICLTGHSLGGTVALHVGRYLVSEHGVAIDTHLFNPHLLSLFDLPTLKVFPCMSAPYNQRHYRDTNIWDASRVQAVGNLLERSPSWIYEALQAEWEQFLTLEDWTPHFYLKSQRPLLPPLHQVLQETARGDNKYCAGRLSAKPYHSPPREECQVHRRRRPIRRFANQLPAQREPLFGAMSPAMAQAHRR